MRRFILAAATTTLLGVALSGLCAPARAADPKVALEDPFGSPILADRQIELLGDPARIRFDPRVIVRAPAAAEDSFNVPVLVDATAIPDVEEIMVFVDFGPIPKILSYFPGRALPWLSLRFKIDQASPVRAAVRTASGEWLLGGVLIDAAGGGCTAPATAYGADDWEAHVGEVHGRLWRGSGRLRVIVDHPMDTGLADGIPVYILETLRFSDPSGAPLARLELHEPVNEDPAFTLRFAPGTLPGAVEVAGRDNNGLRIRAVLHEGGLGE